MERTALIDSAFATAPDAALVARLRGGDGAAFELVMRRHNRRLYRLARGVLGNDAEAEEVVQDTWVTAYEKLATFRGPDGFAAWLGRIALNKALAGLRRRAPLRPLDPWDDGPRNGGPGDGDDATGAMAGGSGRQIVADRPDPEFLTARREMKDALERSIDRLPPAFRTVFLLRDVEGLSVAETAATLDLRPETVKTRLHRARAQLRRNLRDEAVTSLSAVFPFAGERCDRMVAAVLERIAGGGSPSPCPSPTRGEGTLGPVRGNLPPPSREGVPPHDAGRAGEGAGGEPAAPSSHIEPERKQPKGD